MMGNVFCRHSNECIQALNLSIMSPWSGGFRDERGIEKAISFISRSSFSGTTAMDLLREAIHWSISSAAGRDPKKLQFLETVAQGHDSRFLQDVLDEYQNQSGQHRYNGDCGYPVGSGSYLSYMEAQVFGTSLPFLNNAASGNADYERVIRENLRSIADRLERDLDNAIRENDYITDESADKLKSVVSELEHCGVSTGFLNSKIDKLAWFVGGDASKIKQLQRALNDLGVGQHLEEDGVYGKETESAIDRLINRVPEILKDPNKLRTLALTVELIDAIGLAIITRQGLVYAIKKSWQLLWNTIWNLGAEYYLRPKGYDVAALLLQHSLNPSPSDLHFSQSHFVTQKIMRSKGFQRAFHELEKNILESPDMYASPGNFSVDFQETGDTDLYYGIGKCEFCYTCTRNFSSVRVKFTMNDKYNFDYIRTIGRSVKQSVAFDFGLGNLANDFGLLSQETGVISPYYIYIEFEKTIDLD